jgi:hypothetical protein
VTGSTRRLLSALLVFHAIGCLASAQEVVTPSGAATKRLRVDLVLHGPPMLPRIEAAAMEEITGIWARYGVDVFLSDVSDIGQEGDVRLDVRLTGDSDQRVASGALGSILFLDAEPQPAINMYPRAIDALVSTATLAGSTELQWPTAFREAVVGRVLGRGLAHEIGHFLLRSRQHPAVGLMRTPHLVPDLVSPDRRRFVLSTDEQMLLASSRSARFRSSPETVRPTGTP